MDAFKRILRGVDSPSGCLILTSFEFVPLSILGAVIIMKASSMYANADGMAMPSSLAKIQSVGA
jgi:hypothetical protein